MTDLEELVQMLSSSSAGVRRAACDELRHASASSRQAVFALETAAHDDDPQVAAAARFALEASVHRNILTDMGRDVPSPAATRASPRTVHGTGSTIATRPSGPVPGDIQNGQEQRLVLEELQQQTRLLKTIATAAQLWLVLTTIGLILGLLAWPF